MWGGRPLRIASVMKILRKSCGAKSRGWPAESVSPVRFRTSLRPSRIICRDTGVRWPPYVHWNSSGIGGFQIFSATP